MDFCCTVSNVFTIGFLKPLQGTLDIVQRVKHYMYVQCSWCLHSMKHIYRRVRKSRFLKCVLLLEETSEKRGEWGKWEWKMILMEVGGEKGWWNKDRERRRMEEKHGCLSPSHSDWANSPWGAHILSLTASFLFIYQPIFIPVTRIQMGSYVTKEEMCCTRACQRRERTHIHKGERRTNSWWRKKAPWEQPSKTFKGTHAHTSPWFLMRNQISHTLLKIHKMPQGTTGL